jgi:hypothetical protein
MVTNEKACLEENIKADKMLSEGQPCAIHHDSGKMTLNAFQRLGLHS